MPSAAPTSGWPPLRMQCARSSSSSCSAVVNGCAASNGTAAYAGHIVGNVKNGANYYVSTGRFTQQYNFGTDTGAFNVTNFDGADYSGAIAASSLRNDFQGANIQGGSNRTMNLRGSFFKSPSQGSGAIPAYVGGDFNVTGNDYKAGGTFAGER